MILYYTTFFSKSPYTDMKFALAARSLAPLVSSASEILLGAGLCRGWQKVSARRKRPGRLRRSGTSARSAEAFATPTHPLTKAQGASELFTAPCRIRQETEKDCRINGSPEKQSDINYAFLPFFLLFMRRRPMAIITAKTMR